MEAGESGEGEVAVVDSARCGQRSSVGVIGMTVTFVGSNWRTFEKERLVGVPVGVNHEIGDWETFSGRGLVCKQAVTRDPQKNDCGMSVCSSTYGRQSEAAVFCVRPGRVRFVVDIGNEIVVQIVDLPPVRPLRAPIVAETDSFLRVSGSRLNPFISLV